MTSVKQKNLTIYGEKPIPWSRALEQLDGGFDATCWLATTRPDGRPHTAGIGALWSEGKFYIVTGANTRKGRNLAKNVNCAVSVALKGLDLVVEGRAAKVTDDATLQRLAKVFAEQGWPAMVKNGAFTAPYSAPSAGPPPWDVYVITPETAFGVATAEPFGATRWRFS
jgi:nitroimidazol reductase NimA-like FMN-containing flavoprotein (pyridoxamine 5'-phosphate oxidase superfamily)